MRFSASFVALVAPLLVSGFPMRRQAAPANAADLLVLKFADVLEQMESAFYSQALGKFQETDFVTAGFADVEVPIQQFTAIALDESTHDQILQSTIQSLGDVPISGCQFDFSSVLVDVATMAATARVVENVGVGAYLGAAHLVTDPVLLTAAASILTVEARHQTILNIINGGSAIPQAFDIALSPSEVLAIASPFITGCEIPVAANPTLTITNTGTVAPGTSLTFSSTAIDSSIDPSTLSCQMMLGGAPFAIVLNYTACVVPSGINGPVAIYVTNSSQPLESNIIDQETNSLVAGPTMAFIDTIPEDLSSLARTGSASSSSSSSSDSSVSSVDSSSASVTVTDSAAATATDASAVTSAVIGTSTSVTTLTPQDASAVISSALASATAANNAASSASAPAATGSVMPAVMAMGTGTIASLPQA